MESSTNFDYRYQLCAQNFPRGAKRCTLVIKDCQTNQYLAIGARTVLHDGEFLIQLHSDHIRQIAIIYAMKLVEDEIQRVKNKIS